MGNTDPIRVLRIITRLNIGGPSIQAMALSDRLRGRGFATRLIHGDLGAGEGDMRYLLSPSVDVQRIASLRRKVSPILDSVALLRLLDVFRDFRPHIVHTHMAKAGSLGRLAAAIYNATAGRDARSRLVHTYHGHVLEGYFSPNQTRLFVAIERQLARITDRIVAISPQIRDELVDDYRIAGRDRFRVIPLGFDLAALAAIDDAARQRARTALSIPPDARVVSTVGRLTAIKQHQLFLETARRVADADRDAVFLVVGDGELRRHLEQAAVDLGLGGRLRFLGWRRDLEAIYGATDVFLLTSRNEGTPVALIEAIAAGCSAVSTDVGGVRDVLVDDSVGDLVALGQPHQLAHCVVRRLQTHHPRPVGYPARTDVVRRFGVARLLADIEAVYRELMEPRHHTL